MSTDPRGGRDRAAQASPWVRLLANLSLVARLGWFELGAFVVVIWLLCAWVAWLVGGVRVHSYSDRQLAMHFVALVFAVYWPVAVWRDEAPAQRGYFYSLPSGRIAAVLLRVLAGLVSLIATLLVAHLGGFAIGAGIGRADELTAVSPLAWLASILGVTIVYLIASAIAVVSDVPGRWLLAFGGLVYAPPLMLPLPQLLQFAFRPGPQWFYHGPIGFDRATSAAITAAQLDNRLIEFTPSQWLPATTFWLLLSALCLWLAARRRIDL